MFYASITRYLPLHLAKKVIFVLLCIFVHINSAYNLTYVLTEEVDPPYVLGDLVSDAHLSTWYTPQQLARGTIAFFPSTQEGAYYFKVEKISDFTQRLILKRRIDREELCSSAGSLKFCQCHLPDFCHVILQFTLTPLEHRLDQMILFAVRVNISDINDNSPVFHPKKYKIRFSESDPPGSSQEIPAANDKDISFNGLITYELSAYRDIFDLKISKSGLLHVVLKEQLDRETKASYNIKVVAKDWGSLRKIGILHLMIEVVDVNDCYPVFSQRDYYVDMVENAAMGKHVINVNAIDRDSGRNGDILFHISESVPAEVAAMFYLNGKSGDLFVQQNIDRETFSTIFLEVIASDRGNSPRSDLARVHITVIDINDNAPRIIIKEDPYDKAIFLKENRPSPLPITSFLVIDNDFLENGTVTCSISNPKFLLRPLLKDEINTYKIVAQFTFDRELTKETSFNLICVDNGNPPLKTEEHLRVVILDDNDHSPKFYESKVRLKLKENNPPGQIIFRVNASDPDFGSNALITYELVQERYNASSIFSINIRSGEIRIVRSLDYEKEKLLTLHVIAKDSGSPPLSSTMTLVVEVIDVNDVTPHLDKVYNLSVYENLPSGTLVSKINAEDPEEGLNGMVVFFGLENPNFAIDKYGKIYTLRSLDREVEPNTYRFSFYAKDLGTPSLTSKSLVIITILDINDVIPQFVFPAGPWANFTVSYQEQGGYPIAQLSARDFDAGANGTVVYSLEPSSNQFRVDASSGRLFTSVQLGSRNIGKQVVLVCVASDLGSPWPLQSKVNLTIHILDIPPRDREYAAARALFKSDLIYILLLVCFGTLIFSAIVLMFALAVRHRKWIHESWIGNCADSLDNTCWKRDRNTNWTEMKRVFQHRNRNLYTSSPTRVLLSLRMKQQNKEKNCYVSSDLETFPCTLHNHKVADDEFDCMFPDISNSEENSQLYNSTLKVSESQKSLYQSIDDLTNIDIVDSDVVSV